MQKQSQIILSTGMSLTKAAIMAKLQQEILPLQGYKKAPAGNAMKILPSAISNAFPNREFPIGAVHEFFCSSAETAAATSGFMAGILSPLMKTGGVSIWITGSTIIFPPALQYFGIAPDKIIFIDLHKERDVLWAMEEALKCEGLAAVIGEMQELSFTASRRLQLLVEQSRVTGFILRNNPRSMNTTACVTRWQITPVPAVLSEGMPGVGFPRWKVDLLKVRNGTPGSWIIEFSGGLLTHILPQQINIIPEQKKKIS